MEKMTAEVNVFQALGQETMVQEIRTEMRPTELLAYVDELPEGGYKLTLQTLGQYTLRTHYRKTLKGAQSLLNRHLEGEYYNEVEITI